jgi:hypothetical protein
MYFNIVRHVDVYFCFCTLILIFVVCFSQNCPPNPPAQIHWKVLDTGTQVAPFWQGGKVTSHEPEKQTNMKIWNNMKQYANNMNKMKTRKKNQKKKKKSKNNYIYLYLCIW